MSRLAHEATLDPSVQRLARGILLDAQVASHAYVDEARAIGQFVKDRVRYLRDPDGVEQLQKPALLVQEIQAQTAQGDCDDMSLLASALLLAIGHQPFYRMVRYEGMTAGPYAHIYVVDYDRNGSGPVERVVLDCILKDKPIGTEVSHDSGDEIAV